MRLERGQREARRRDPVCPPPARGGARLDHHASGPNRASDPVRSGAAREPGVPTRVESERSSSAHRVEAPASSVMEPQTITFTRVLSPAADWR
eukprot:6896746-Prymnesium_polylepis.1